MVALDADDPYLVAGDQRRRIELRFLHRRIVDRLRVVRDNREIVQRVQLLDLGLDLERAGKSHGNITDSHRHRIAIDEHEPALLVDDHAGTVVMTIRDARNRVRQIEGHDHE